MPSKSVGMSVNPTMRLNGIMLIPMYERRAAPFSMIPSTIRCTRLMGSANPTPLLVLSKLTDLRVDADHFTRAVQQRTTGVARVHVSISLNHTRSQQCRVGRRLYLAVEPGYYAVRHREVLPHSQTDGRAPPLTFRESVLNCLRAAECESRPR